MRCPWNRDVVNQDARQGRFSRSLRGISVNIWSPYNDCLTTLKPSFSKSSFVALRARLSCIPINGIWVFAVNDSRRDVSLSDKAQP